MDRPAERRRRRERGSPLDRFLRVAVELGADEVEIDYKDGKLRVTPLRGGTGVVIGTIDSRADECDRLVDAVRALRRRKTVRIGKTVHGVALCEYESFGERAYRILLAGPVRRPPPRTAAATRREAPR